MLHEDFVSMASHELKTPLTGLLLRVNGLQRMLGRGGPPDLEKIGRRVDNIHRQLTRLTDLVDGFLDAGRASVGLETEDVDLEQIVRVVTERSRREMVRKSCALSPAIAGMREPPQSEGEGAKAGPGVSDGA